MRDVWEAYVLPAIIVALSWIGYQWRRQDTRITVLERTDTIRRDEFERTITGLRADIKDGNRETHRRLDDLIKAQMRRE